MNEAVEHAAELAENNMKMLAHARGGGKMPTQDWKRAQALLVDIAVLTRNPKVQKQAMNHRPCALKYACHHPLECERWVCNADALQNQEAVKGKAHPIRSN